MAWYCIKGEMCENLEINCPEVAIFTGLRGIPDNLVHVPDGLGLVQFSLLKALPIDDDTMKHKFGINLKKRGR